MELKSLSGTPLEKKYISKIQNLLSISNQYWPHATLLILKTFCLACLPLFFDKFLNRKITILICILIFTSFNEIIPQYIGQNYQLKVAALTSDLIKGFMIITSPITYIFGKVLNYIFGPKHCYRLLNNDLKALIEMHKINSLKKIENDDIIIEGSNNSRNLNTNNNSSKLGLNDEEANLMISALEIREKKAIEIMIPISTTYKIDYDLKLDQKILKQILSCGYSRIPVYANHNQYDILGLVRIKQLVGLDYNENKSLREFGIKISSPLVIHPGLGLIDLLREFRKGKSHMAFVTEQVEKFQSKFGLTRTNSSIKIINLKDRKGKNNGKILGIITLEDVIEHMFNLEIFDEDDYEKMNESTKNIVVINNNYNNFVQIIDENSKSSISNSNSKTNSDNNKRIIEREEQTLSNDDLPYYSINNTNKDFII